MMFASIAVVVTAVAGLAASAALEPSSKCTVESLTEKILTTRDAAWRPSRRFNEVYPNLVVGEGTNALIHPILKQLGITHVLNCASPSAEDMQTRISRQVEYPHEYETQFNITVHGLPIHDTGTYEVGSLFQEGADFIDDVLTSGGRVYVNSFTGSSRAGTIVVGYFMIKLGYSASDALHIVRLGREVRPEKGFLKQLCELEEQLHASTVPPTTTHIPTTPPSPKWTLTVAPTTRGPRVAVRMPWQPPRMVNNWLNTFLG